MKIKAIKATNVRPIIHFQATNLSETIVFAGPNGVGKTRLIEALISAFQSPGNNATVQLTIEATSEAEKKFWGKPILDTSSVIDGNQLAALLQKAKRRSQWESSVINFESDRSIQQIAPFNFSWDYQDPFDETMGWTFGWGGLRSRFQDTLHSIFRKVRSRREQIARKAEALFHGAPDNSTITLDRTEFPDPLEPFKHAFRQLLAPKELLDAEPQRQELEYKFEGATFPITSLSSGEREVVNVVFDFILRSPRDSIIIFDEPELHLHPELSYKLLQTLRTVDKNNQFILCTHSPDIITASLDNSVIFIAPPKGTGENQAIAVQEDDNTHQALRLLGQSIGIISLGKKIVLIEGAHSSLDKQVYGSILRDRFPNLVLVPGGGKGLLKSFDVLHRDVLDKTLWGVEFFMLCDRDAIPLFKDETELKKLAGKRLEILGRYHIENYFLDENVLAAIFANMEPEESTLRDPASIRTMLREIAQGYVSYAVALNVTAYLRELVGNIDVMPKDCTNKDEATLVSLIVNEARVESRRVLNELDLTKVEQAVHEHFGKLKDSLDKDTEMWKMTIPGKAVLNTFAAKVKLDVSRLKTLFIREAAKRSPSPFDEIIAIFAKFAV